jgi:hypothetical protein
VLTATTVFLVGFVGSAIAGRAATARATRPPHAASSHDAPPVREDGPLVG